MFIERLLFVSIFTLHCVRYAFSGDESEFQLEKEWIPAAQGAIWDSSELFERILVGTSEMEKGGKGLKLLRSVSSKVSGIMGVAGTLFSIVLALLPPEESPELKFMKLQFGKLSEKIDKISGAVDDVKNLIKLHSQKAAYIQEENKINTGYSKMTECQQKVLGVLCTNKEECRKNRSQIAANYIKFMNVRASVENIVRGTTSNGAFSTSLLFLIKEASLCNVPKIGRFTNRVAALIMKGMFVAMFHDLLTKPDFDYLDDITHTSNFLRDLEKARQDIEDSCFDKITYWMRLNIGKSHEMFTTDSKETNKALLQRLNSKFPWVQWQVCTSKGKKGPAAGPRTSIRHKFVSSSKDKNVHAVVIPTTEGKVTNLILKRASWRKLVSSLDIKDLEDDLDNEILEIEGKINKSLELEGEVQSFAVLQGDDFYLGYYSYSGNEIESMHQESISEDKEVNNLNLNSHLYKQDDIAFAFVVTFNQDPMKCSKSCNKGTCNFLPYSTEMVCRCEEGFDGERCEISYLDTKQHSVINSLIRNTMKLPTFTSIQGTLHDIQLYVKVSLENIDKAVSRIGASIDNELKVLGEYFKETFTMMSIRIKYKESIENLKYFQTLSNRTSNELGTNGTAAFTKTEMETSIKEEKEIASYLLSPIGIQKWLYQLDFLIRGNNDDILSPHKSVLFMVMDRFKHLLCFQNYKMEVDRVFQQLMLLQLQGYTMWAWAYKLLNMDSISIGKRHQNMLTNQMNYFRENTCSVTIPNSVNMENCSGGFYIHSTMDTSIICKSGNYLDDKKITWVSKVLSFTSQYSRKQHSAAQVIGTPDEYDNGIDYSKSWKPSATKLNKKQYLRVQVSDHVYPTEVHVYETRNGGAVKKIMALQPDRRWYTLWQAGNVAMLSTNQTLKFVAEFQGVPFTTNELRVYFATEKSKGSVEIDAISLIGRPLLKDEVVMWFRVADIKQHEELKTIFTVSMKEKIYVQSVAMFKSPTAGQVKRITFNNSDGRWWKEGWSSANSSVTRGVLFTPKIELQKYQSSGIMIQMSESNNKQLNVVIVNGFRKLPDTCTILTSKSCSMCNCSQNGSAVPSCNEVGKCTCKEKYYGKKCSNKDCEMGEWSAWSKCPCGVTGRRKSRSRSSKSFAAGYGKRCPTNNVQRAPCEKKPCKCKKGYYGNVCQDRDCTLTSWTTWSRCTPCPGACKWPSCPKTVPKHEYRSRHRGVKINKAGAGRCEAERRQSAYCGYCKMTSTCSMFRFYAGNIMDGPCTIFKYIRDYQEPRK